MIKAQIEITNYQAFSMDTDQLKDYVEHVLSREITEEVKKHMTITKTVDPLNSSTIYTGAMTVTATGVGIGTVNTTTRGVQKNLRVIEYTKNGKITRVELQQYDDELDDWVKIPRIQKEE